MYPACLDRFVWKIKRDNTFDDKQICDKLSSAISRLECVLYARLALLELNSDCLCSSKLYSWAGHQWLIPIILEFRRITV
jgi:hypothetical protein